VTGETKIWKMAVAAIDCSEMKSIFSVSFLLLKWWTRAYFSKAVTENAEERLDSSKPHNVLT